MVDRDAPRVAAIKRLKGKRDFRKHLGAYVIVNAMLVGIWTQSGQGNFWPIWVMIFWGVGLAFNAWNAYFRRPISEEEIRREMERDQ